MNMIFLNGKFLPEDQATVSVMDRGFLFGDGVYEVIPVYQGNIFRCEQHIARLFRSLDNIHLSLSYNASQLKAIFTALLEHNAHLGQNQSLYLQVTRGAAPIRNHAFPKGIEPTICAFTFPLKTLPLAQLSQGMSAITLDDTRWQFCQIKAISLLPNVLLYQQALDKGCAEAILIRDGFAVEGSTSNLFIVKDNVIKTPPLSNAILGGVTRDLVIELAREHQYPFEEVAISEGALLDADEVWITSSTREIYPIVQLNNVAVGNAKPGPVWHKMIKHYHLFIQSL